MGIICWLMYRESTFIYWIEISLYLIEMRLYLLIRLLGMSFYLLELSLYLLIYLLEMSDSLSIDVLGIIIYWIEISLYLIEMRLYLLICLLGISLYLIENEFLFVESFSFERIEPLCIDFDLSTRNGRLFVGWCSGRGGGLGSRPKKMYGERLGDGVEYHSMKPTPRR